MDTQLYHQQPENYDQGYGPWTSHRWDTDCLPCSATVGALCRPALRQDQFADSRLAQMSSNLVIIESQCEHIIV